MKPDNEYRVEGGRRVSWRVAYKEQLTDGAWRVIFDGKLTTPRFQHEGAARAYLAALINGERKPEFA